MEAANQRQSSVGLFACPRKRESGSLPGRSRMCFPLGCGMDTPETQSVLVTALEKRRWRRFYVHLAGDTNGTHKEFVSHIRQLGHTKVSSPEESDYVVVFCPIASQAETDFSEALEDIPFGKPTILMVMHHTVDRNQVVAESRRLVNNPNVHLTVDVLLHKGKIMKCDQNRKAWFDFVMFLAASFRSNNKKIMIFLMVTMTALILVGVIVATTVTQP